MATEVERLVVMMEANAAGMQRQLDQAQRNSDRALAAMERRFNQSASKVSKSFSTMAQNVQLAIAAIGVGAVVQDATKLADSYKAVRNQLTLLKDVLGDVDEAQTRLVDTSVDAKVSLTTMAQLLSSATRAGKEFGATGDQAFLFAEAVGKGASIANTGVAAMEGALTQLAQAVASPRVQLGEFNSVVEGTPRLAQAFAEGVLGAGASAADLRREISAGKVAGSDLFKGLLSQLPTLRREFASTETLVGSAMTNLTTKLTQFVGELDESTGATAELADVINHVAKNLDDFAEAAIVAGTVLLGGLAGRGAVAGVTALSTAIATATAGLTAMQIAAAGGAVAMRALGATLAFFGGPIGLAVTALGAGLAYLALKSSDANVQMEESRKAADRLAPTWARLKEVNAELGKAEGERAKQLERTKQLLIASANAEVENARRKLQTAEATLAAADAERVASGSFAIGEGAGFGDAMEVGAKQAGVRAARAALKAAQDELTKNLPTVDIGADLNPGAPAKGGGGDKDKAKAIKVTTDELARRHAITMAEADGNHILADYLRDQEEILSRTTAYQEAGLKTTQAQAKATAEVFAEREAGRAKEAFDGWQQSMRDAFAIIDAAPDSITGLEEELQRLREQFDLIKAAGGEVQWLRTYADRLEELARRTGDAKRSVEELRALEGLSAEDRARAEYRIQGAARQARELRDEELQKPFRYDEIRDDVKGALRQAFATGNWDEAFRDKLLNALTRAMDRSLDRFVDGVFDAMGQVKIGGSGSGGGNIVSSIIAGIGKFFGGGRANGGPVSPGMFYKVNENTPNSEFFTPNVPGMIVPRLPQITVPKSGGAPVNVALNDNRTMTFTGTPNETIQALGEMMARDKAQRRAETVAIVRDAQRRRGV